MTGVEPTVFVVEDDASVRDALALLLGLKGYRTAIFADAESFLSAYRPEWRGCLLVDIRMPGMDGLALQKHLRAAGSRLPVVVMTGHGDVSSAREAFRSEAVDFLEKPLDHVKMLAAIDEALTRVSTLDVQGRKRAQAEKRIGSLTPREKEVMELVVAGLHNRQIGEKLGISVRTVEVHKARLMQKLQVGNIPELVRLSLDLARSGPNT